MAPSTTLPIAVTGSTGAIGSRVTRALLAAGHEVIQTTARYSAGEALAAELSGADSMLLVSGRESADRVAEHRSALDAAIAAGVKRIVYTSFYGAGAESTFTFGRDHWHTESYIRESGLRFVMLRDNLYQQSIARLVGQDDVIRGPAGDGRVAAVSQEDVAECAIAALLDPAHDFQTYDLTGPRALSMIEVAAILSELRASPVTYVAETEEEAYRSRAHFEAAPFEVAGWVSSYLAIAAGELATVSEDVATITGHPAKDLADLELG